MRLPDQLRALPWGMMIWLAGCSEVREHYVGAVWIQRDSSLAYLVEVDTLKKNVMGTAYYSGPLQLYTTKWNGSGLEAGRRLLEVDGDFCEMMFYRPVDSLLAFSIRNAGDCRRDAAFIRAGTVRAGGFSEWKPQDREKLRSLLYETGAAFDSGLYAEGGGHGAPTSTLCLEGKGCHDP